MKLMKHSTTAPFGQQPPNCNQPLPPPKRPILAWVKKEVLPSWSATTVTPTLGAASISSATLVVISSCVLFRASGVQGRFPETRDSLKRHVITHGPSAVRSYAATASQEAKRVSRACVKCTKSKQRCNGQQPCDRCRKKRSICEYSMPSSGRSVRGEETQSLSHQSPPPAEIDLAQAEAYQQGTVAHTGSLVPPDVSQTTELMDYIFNPFPFMALDNVDLSLAGFPAPFFLDSNPHSAGFPNEHLHSLSYGTPNIASFDDGTRYSNGEHFSGTPMFADPNSLPTNSQSMATTKETAILPAEHNQQKSSTSNIPESTSDEQEILATEDFCHVERVSEDAYNAILNFYREHCQKSNTPQLTPPSIQVVNTFIQLYFEHFHPVMPIIHRASFKPTSEKWILVAAIASVGCQYSRIPTRSQMHTFFWRLLQSIILNLPMQRLLRNDEVYVAQAVLLHNLSLFDGSKNTVCTMQYQRNILITSCRPFLVGHASPFTRLSSINLKENGESWSQWILSESWKRTIYYTWVLECFQLILFDLPPSLAIWELRVGLPCDDDLWNCPDSGECERQFQSQEDPPSLVHLFSSFNTNNTIQSLGKTTSLIIMISLFSEEKTLRKQAQCLPYSTFLSSADPPSQLNNIPNILASQFKDLDPSQRPGSDKFTLSPQQQKLYHFLSILRHIPPNTMHASYGWMTTKAEAEIADSQVAELMRDAKQARESLVHAAQLFRLLREQNIVTFYDPFCLLIATQYIRKYTRHVLEERGEARSEVSGPPFRIDRLTSEEQKAWIQTGDAGSGIHVTGIGVLEKPGSSSRAFKEAARILRGSVAWARISQMIARSLMQSLRGEMLTMPA
ncbi:Zn(II)2Cys6 transcription factor [Aspergillus affinis]|uniref:Zn(II)2Cys6 transcription factor n=1 Tax=Aspergillus affinis TaxID=1070780 RepID=UPI0022FDF270|nr:fungal-specific transcription factor domain-containing protein [Aspergillus affinis]KAI9041369.1 fungal-specific transcription factor domain-containing protein [Aspergillus affinis]